MAEPMNSIDVARLSDLDLGGSQPLTEPVLADRVLDASPSSPARVVLEQLREAHLRTSPAFDAEAPGRLWRGRRARVSGLSKEHADRVLSASQLGAKDRDGGRLG